MPASPCPVPSTPVPMHHPAAQPCQPTTVPMHPPCRHTTTSSAIVPTDTRDTSPHPVPAHPRVRRAPCCRSSDRTQLCHLNTASPHYHAVAPSRRRHTHAEAHASRCTAMTGPQHACVPPCRCPTVPVSYRADAPPCRCTIVPTHLITVPVPAPPCPVRQHPVSMHHQSVPPCPRVTVPLHPVPAHHHVARRRAHGHPWHLSAPGASATPCPPGTVSPPQ
jgi:hypothetical protein